MWKKECNECKHFNECDFKNEERPKGIKILHTTDIHASTTNFPKLKELKEKLEEDNHIILVDSGDINEAKKDITNYLNDVGYDVVVGGNHDCLATYKEFIKRVEKSNFEYLSYDLRDKKTQELIFKPYRIFELNGLKIAFIGQSLLNGWTNPKSTRNMEDLQKVIDEVRYCDYVVLLAHQFTKKNMESVCGLDLVLCGHTHSKQITTFKDKEKRNVPVANAGLSMKQVDVIDLITGEMEQIKL